mgnify:CR=1 FL=1
MALNLNNDNDEIMAEINMTPLIDVMLVLLIIFMVTSSVALQSGLDIDLPETTSSSEADPKKGLIISLDSNGRLYVAGTQTTLETMPELVKSKLLEMKTKLVVFEGDRGASLGMAIKVMDIAKAQGAENFAIAADDAPTK